MKKAIGQTVRDLKREVNKKVLKVPGIEQKVLDATSNEAWGPHGSLLADIAQATKNFHEYQMIMAVIWRRINDTGKNWRHVYKALTVLEYLVGHGSERVIEEIREHGHQISVLSNFQYIDSSGRDQGNNVRKKSQSLVILMNDKERIIEVRQKAAANRDRFRNNSTGGMYKPGSDSSSGAYGDRYDDDRYGSREEDRSGYGYGRERELGYRDDDWYSLDVDLHGRDYEERYSRDGYRDDEYSGRSRSADDYQYGSRSRSSDRDHDRGYDDDGQHSSRAKAEDHSLEGRVEQRLSQQNMGAPPSYEEAAGESRSPVHNERDEETSAASAPKDSSPVSDNPRQTSAPTGSFPLMNDNPTEATVAATTATSGKLEVEASDEFDPRVPVSAALAGANIVEIDLFGSLSESFSSNALALVPSASATSNPEGNVNLDSTVSFAAVPSTSNNFNQSFEDPFGDSPFKAIPSTESAPYQPQTHQSLEPSQLSDPNLEAVSNLGFGDSFSVVPYSTSGASDTLPLSTNSQFLSQDFSTPPQETDILADILPPAPLPGKTSQQNFSASPDSQSSLSFSASSGKMASQSFFVQSGQLMQQGFSAATSQPAPQAFSGPSGQPVQPPFSSPISQHAQQPFSAHVGQSTQSSDHMYGGFHSQAGSLTPVASSLFPQSQPTQSQSAYYFPQHGGSTAKSPADQASQFNSGNFVAQQGNAAPSTHQPLPLHNASNNAVSSTGSNSMFSQSSKEKFETKSTVWADTLSRGLVNLNISGPKINPLADIGIDFDAINRKEKRMEKPTTTAVTSTVTMGKAMGSGSGIGRAGAGALRPSPPMMGMGRGPGVGIGMNAEMDLDMGLGMDMSMGRRVQMQPPPPTTIGLPPGFNINIPGNYNNSMMGTGIGGYRQHQQPYDGGGGGHR